MRTGLAAGVIATGLLLAGCGSGADSGATPKQLSPQVEDRCSLLTDEQAKTLGLDKPSKPGVSNGVAGCQYDAGTWSVFAAANPQLTFEQFTQAEQGAQRVTVGGYQAAKINNAGGCTLVVDISDHGSLMTSALVRAGAPSTAGTSCDAATRAAEASLQNLKPA